jgi:hypothetical protein
MRPPLSPSTRESAIQKVPLAEDEMAGILVIQSRKLPPNCSPLNNKPRVRPLNSSFSFTISRVKEA